MTHHHVHHHKHHKKHTSFFLVTACVAAVITLYTATLFIAQDYFLRAEELPAEQQVVAKAQKTKPRKVTHVARPENVRAIYMTNFIAGIPERRNALIKLIDETEINAVILDIKDYTGKIGFKVHDPYLQEIGSVENRIKDIDALLDELHAHNIYVIGRVSVFQDQSLTAKHPDFAMKRRSNKNEIWADYKGVKWLDAAAYPVWNYIVALSKESYSRGFDEINFDYIRFPSDGDMEDLLSTWSSGQSRADVMENFFIFINQNMKSPELEKALGGVPVISADLFGMTTINIKDDLSIGQIWERALPYFDVLAPMVYPSHYTSGFAGIADPNEDPGAVIHYSLSRALKRTMAAMPDASTSTAANKIRPWYQDFHYGAHYDAADVRAQIEAGYALGINSWMLWSPSNVYTKDALLKE